MCNTEMGKSNRRHDERGLFLYVLLLIPMFSLGLGGSCARVFETGPLSPTQRISVVAALGTQFNSAAINRTTDNAADSQVGYGRSANCGQVPTLKSSLITNRSSRVPGLSVSALYQDRVRSEKVPGSFAEPADLTHKMVASPSGTPLSVLAASMKAGNWAELRTNNIVPVLGQGDFNLNVLPYADSGAWDAVGKRFWFVGGDHTGQEFSPSRQV
jgi:hypothetical protein